MNEGSGAGTGRARGLAPEGGRWGRGGRPGGSLGPGSGHGERPRGPSELWGGAYGPWRGAYGPWRAVQTSLGYRDRALGAWGPVQALHRDQFRLYGGAGDQSGPSTGTSPGSGDPSRPSIGTIPCHRSSLEPPRPQQMPPFPHVVPAQASAPQRLPPVVGTRTSKECHGAEARASRWFIASSRPARGLWWLLGGTGRERTGCVGSLRRSRGGPDAGPALPLTAPSRASPRPAGSRR